MRVIVTGGAGLIGGRLAARLVRLGQEVHVLDNLSGGSRERIPHGARLYEEDAAHPAVAEWIADLKPAVVFHLAAQVSAPLSMQRPAQDGQSNVLGTMRVLEGCRRSGSKLVFSSTSAVYGGLAAREAPPFAERSRPNPESFYALSKWIAEQYVMRYGKWCGVRYAILRYANVYGPGQTGAGEGGVVRIFVDQWRREKPLVIHGDGGQTRDFIHVDDVVEANLAAAGRAEDALLNIGTGRSTSVRELAEMLFRIGGRPAEIAWEATRAGDVRHSRLSWAKARRSIGWRPRIRLEDGLRMLLEEESGAPPPV